ncbi:MAG: type II toxin-antitoxin system prevent-host-death family antitoxin [Actinobacteria bacterium]|nr:type II toxin-antitoxin system prevent-host-death family antitoxin [Actinomycetota bacterium]
MEGEPREPAVVVRNGKPVAVIIDIDDYHELLERIEDAEACAMLDKLRKEPAQFRNLDKFLAEFDQDV